MTTQMARIHRLRTMLRFKRPMGSRTEHQFRKYWLHSIKDSWEDEHGNIHVLIPRKDGTWPKVVWASHTDTVHNEDGYQTVKLDSGVLTVEDSNCLGADCTVGVWLMWEMIHMSVPGHYIFHWGEEEGCIGSGALVEKTPHYVRRAKAIISLDRRGFNEVITFQRRKRSCSDDFAASVAMQLPGDYKPSPRGIYTDSAEYTDIVGECTNISVGYQHEHTAKESLNLKHVLELLRYLAKFNEDDLIYSREPGDEEELPVIKGGVYVPAGVSDEYRYIQGVLASGKWYEHGSYKGH